MRYDTKLTPKGIRAGDPNDDQALSEEQRRWDAKNLAWIEKRTK